MSNNQDIYERVQIIVAEALQSPQEMITTDLAFGDIPQWDSLGHMEIILRLEDEFGLAIDTDLIAQLVSIPAICEFIEENNHAEQ